ncbi:MAG TPA: O-antigen ligase family protein [Candidatus Hydrogenedentes bacterium]|nr:O-antigen ligase family protein [Candidatus Hydrogenedentota bacterium]
MVKKKKGRSVSGATATARPESAAESSGKLSSPTGIGFSGDWQGLLIRVLLAAWMPLVVLALWPYVNNPATPIKILLTGITAVAVSILVYTRGPLPRSDLLIGFMLWLAWHGWTALGALDPLYSLRSIAPVACWVILGVGAMAAVSRASQGWNLLCVWILALACSALYAVAQRYGLDPFPWATRNVEEYRALPATFGNPNYAAHALITGVVAAVGLIARRPTRWFALLCALPMLWHLWATSMRAAVIALTVTVAAWALWTGASIIAPRRRVMVAFLTAGCAILAGLLLLTLTHDTFSKALTRRVARQDSLALRVNGWQGAARMIREHPIVGHGPGMYFRHAPSRWQEYEKRWYARSNQRNAHTHNEYLEFGVELGLPGLLLYLWLLLRHMAGAIQLAAWHPSADTRRFGRFAALAAVAMAVDSLFGFNLHLPVTGGFFFLLLGMTEGVRLGSRTATEPETRDKDATIHGDTARSWTRIPRLALPALAVIALKTCWTDYQCDQALLRTRAVVEQMQKNTSLPRAVQDQLERTLKEAMARFPWESTFPQRLGWLMLQQSRFAEADSALAAAIRLEPWTVRLWSMRAQAMNGWAAQAVNREQNLPKGSALAHRAWLYGNRAEALCEPFPAVHDAQWRTALFFLVTGQNNSQISGYLPSLREFFAYHTEKALEYGSKDPAAVLTTLAGEMIAWNDPDRGAPYLAASIQLDPKSRDTWRVVTRYGDNGQAGRIVDAILKGRALLRRALPENQDLFLAANEESIRYFVSEGKDPVLARTLFQDGARALPGRLEAWAMARYIPGTREEILRLISATAKAASNAHPVIAGLATGNADAAFKAIEQASDPAGGLNHPGNLTGDPMAWLLSLAAPLARSPEQQLALGRALAQSGTFEQADQVLAAALGSASGMPDGLQGRILAWRAAALAGLNRKSEALQTASRAVTLVPGDGEALLILARCLRDNNRLDEALAAYKKALAALPQGSGLFSAATREYGELSRQRKSGPGNPGGGTP